MNKNFHITKKSKYDSELYSSDAYNQGMEDYNLGIHHSMNPFNDKKKHNSWNSGWEEAEYRF